MCVGSVSGRANGVRWCMARYMQVKCWEEMDAECAVMTGDVGVRDSTVVERYLDDVRERFR